MELEPRNPSKKRAIELRKILRQDSTEGFSPICFQKFGTSFYLPNWQNHLIQKCHPTARLAKFPLSNFDVSTLKIGRNANEKV
jgi:hypothetical protein